MLELYISLSDYQMPQTTFNDHISPSISTSNFTPRNPHTENDISVNFRFTISLQMGTYNVGMTRQTKHSYLFSIHVAIEVGYYVVCVCVCLVEAYVGYVFSILEGLI